MKTTNLQIVRTLLDVSVIVNLSDKSSFQMYGQIANGEIDENSIFPALSDKISFFELLPDVQKEILAISAGEFKKFC